ncbi:MAG: hypothetical protein ACI835_004993 [Planctomycetota bacterium]|jgi:hypothetical protein
MKLRQSSSGCPSPCKTRVSTLRTRCCPSFPPPPPRVASPSAPDPASESRASAYLLNSPTWHRRVLHRSSPSPTDCSCCHSLTDRLPGGVLHRCWRIDLIPAPPRALPASRRASVALSASKPLLDQSRLPPQHPFDSRSAEPGRWNSTRVPFERLYPEVQGYVGGELLRTCRCCTEERMLVDPSC